MNTAVVQIEESTWKTPTPEISTAVAEPKKRILIVESDNEGARKLALQLGSTGYEVITHDPANAPAAAEKLPPDLVILDISLLGDAGFGLAERIQQSDCWCVPTIFVTAGTEPRLRKKAEVFEAVGFFEKTYNTNKLI